MKLNHIAITITDISEIEGFYKNLLGMKDVRSFEITKDKVIEIFGVEQEITAYQLQKDDLVFEVFVLPKPFEKAFNHICISVPDREGLIVKARQNNYDVIRIKRDHFDLIFVKDKSGNIFEIKQD
jgi:catechol 2,3-dioxygenase-like lactoylglutathione lyase family enzyme